MLTKNAIDWNNDFNYPLQWIYESEFARWEYQRWLYRMNQAMLGNPSRNIYKEEITSNLKNIPDADLSQDDRARCLDVPCGQSFILSKAISNRANQMAGGVEAYEYQINDPYMLVDDDTEELLAAKCEQDYIENNLELLSSTFSRDLDMTGVAAVLVKYNPETDKNDIYRLNAKNIWFDTRYTSTGKERFRGYSTMISWDKLKEMILKDGDIINYDLDIPDRSIYNKADKWDPRIKVGQRKITSLNDLDIYIQDINKIASSPSLQGFPQDFFEYSHDLRSCYNLDWYRTFATDAAAKTRSGYNGNDVELTVMYDLERKVEFKIINRRFVISANAKAFRRKIKFPISNPITNETHYRMDDFCLECPLKFQFEEQENRDKFPYPTAQAWKLLDSFDQLCAWRAKRDHVTKLLSILRIETNGADASSLRKVLNVMGVVLDDIQGDINSINFAYDYTPIDSQIMYLENMIYGDLHSYDQFDALQTMGDRASAAESGMAIGAIAQGLATHQNAIMDLYADIARQCIANRVAYSPMQEFPVNNAGGYSAITIQQMALNAVVRVKPKLAKKVQERMIATNALTLLGTLKDVLTPEGVAFFAEQAMLGNVPRKMAKTFVQQPGASEEEIALAQQQAQNQAQMLQQNQQMYEQNPVPYEVDNTMQNSTPEELDDIISGLTEQQEEGETEAPQSEEGEAPIDMTSQEGARETNLEGLTPDNGSQFANPNSEGNF